MKSIKLAIFLVLGVIFSGSVNALDADGNSNGWISLGVISFIHMGTDGDGNFHLNGTDQGKCAGVTPQYFRVDMNLSHFKEFYAWLLTMQAQGKSIDCSVDSGCGTSQVWVRYCRGSLL